jgi:alpha-amylase
MLNLIFGVALIMGGAKAVTEISTTVQLFEWSWSDVANECETFLGPKGFKSVQVSPPNEHITGYQWWTRYQPVTYNLTSRSGDQSQFIDMVSRCKKVGVSIIVDAVINHMAAGSGKGVAGSSYGNRQYPYYGPQDFHHDANNLLTNCQVTDYSNKYNVQYCDLVGLPDLCTGCDYVQGQIAQYINNIYSMGVAGIRIDAAKHQDAGEMSGYLKRIPSDMFVNQEVIGSSGEAVQPSMYYYLGHVTEFGYANQMGNDVKYQGNMNNLQYVGNGLMPTQYACAFMDNHDTQRNGQAPLTYKNGDSYTLASMFMLAWPYGANVRVMSSYYFTNTDAGPPGVGVNNGANCNNGYDWVCEHRRTGIANMVAWRNAAGSEAVQNWQSGGSNQIAFSRGNQAFIAMNRDESNSWYASNLYTGMPAGKYCNVLANLGSDTTSSCSDIVEVDSNGKVTIQVPKLYGIAIHSGAKL